ncbi:MAG: DUF402 domain-containing protein [Candidatus Eisenbacteria bacterium]|uniref:DUF402 domain-containing protein n=1 Tax=Eiseniibacteriota bacterium TaxID=2212470 RepID=A0A956N9U9_UNCEI|nr:DUF402 domain-containing protein [Candidatus Eisenbacteria bacterium]
MSHLWKPGSVVTVTGTVRDKIWYAEPMTVVRDSGELTVLHVGPGAEYLMPDRLLQLPPADRHSPVTWSIRESGEWTLVRRSWTSTHMLTFLYPETFFAIRMLFQAETWTHLCWYVNFQRPYQRTPIGFETLDLALDFIVPADDPDKCIVKDEEQFLAGVRSGHITSNDVAGIEAARRSLPAKLTELTWEPFLSDWTQWRPDVEWPAQVVDASFESRVDPHRQ